MAMLADAAFLAQLQAAFGHRLGRFLSATARLSYPLGLNAGAAPTARTVAIGNAAQTLHPVAGQGLNLGLRDAAVLARMLARDAAPATLRRYAEERRADRGLTIRLTDAMARLFTDAPQGPVSQGMLGLSLALLDAVPPARRLLAEQMMFGRRGS
jgi:2-octaprenyl-6-methoxyphenol hydroxylase